MRFNIPSAIVGVVVGAFITSIFGPIAQEIIRDKFLRQSNWEGDWETVTCFPDAKYEWDVSFSQVGNAVTGQFHGASANLKMQNGSFSGNVVVNVLKGTWTQFSNTGPNGGWFEFTLDPNYKYFSGNYKNDDTGKQAVWMGSRDGNRPSCPW